MYKIEEITNKILCGDSLALLKEMPENFIDLTVTSPPYWGLRDYGVEGQLGLEKTPEEYVAKMVSVFREVKRVLKKEGVMFLNLGDSYAGSGKGRNGDGTPGKTESLNKNNRGSMAGVILPVNAKRGDAYDISDKEQVNYQDDGCLCENLCDECLSALRHSPHTFRERVSKLPPLLSESNHGHKELQSDHLPTSDSFREEVHNEVAIQGSSHYLVPVVEPIYASPLSTKSVSSRQRQVKIHQSDNSLASQSEVGEKNPDDVEFVDKLVCICGTELTVRPLCRCKSGISSSYKAYPHFTNTPLKSKDLVGIPWRVAFALQADGWYLRQDIIWAKPNPMPESVTDRCTKSHEYIFLLTKSPKYYFDNEAIKEKGVMQSSGSDQRDTQETHGLGGGNSGINEAKQRMKKELQENGYVMRNKRSVWTITTKPFKEAHFAIFPEDLIVPMIKAGCPEKGICLDPFMGAGTTALVAKKLKRNYVGCELNPEYIKIAEKRLANYNPLF